MGINTGSISKPWDDFKHLTTSSLDGSWSDRLAALGMVPTPVKASTKKEAMRKTLYKNSKQYYKPARIIYNSPATIVFLSDGTKTVVKKRKGEKFNEYNAFCAALAKKVFESNSAVNKIVKSGTHQG